MAMSLLIIEGEMLHAHCHTVLLNLLDIWNAHLGSKIRILTHILEVTAAERGTIDVHSWSKEHILLTVAGLLTD